MSGAHTEDCIGKKRPPPMPKRKPAVEPKPIPVVTPAPPAQDDWLAKLEAQSFPQRKMAQAMKKIIVRSAIGATLIGVMYIGAVVIPRYIPDSPRPSARDRKPLPELKLEEMNETHAVDLTQR
jgi:hypothetical protein